ncbi:pyruvate dehydrogenase E1 component subunit alpha, mitochondrial-like [Anthonomus grandis grandis]|uniref:pyruvate dehydrogenase E1 component subunit alpha, mitochondrial-like n=1 Tax=Anthonomus grandis grandis TaxID=2921223 RepID=UPI0021655670|nr:pyruvate dehydrogenase E1 component subunit alpha, mitochondrial-like [Anthonomus grandis grandis]
MFRRALNSKTLPRRSLSFDITTYFSEDGPITHLLDETPPKTVEVSKEEGLRAYQQMDLIRRCELATARLYNEKKIRGLCHLYSGQEAIAVGINSILKPDDTIITTYRCHSWFLLKTNDLVSFFGELMGYTLGDNRGKGGSMHLYAPNFYGGNGIVGANVPLGTGLAFQHQYQNTDKICVTLMGDGSYNNGQVHEAFNIAKLHNLPIIYVVENNNFAMGTSVDRHCANPDYYKSCSFIPGLRLNGMNLLTVKSAVEFAVKHVRSKKGPILLEAKTYRYGGHSVSDPGTSYRKREEVTQVMKEKDCIKWFGDLLVESKLATAEELKDIKKSNISRIKADLAKAKAGKPPGTEELTHHVYTTYQGTIRMCQAISAEMPFKEIKRAKIYVCCF